MSKRTERTWTHNKLNCRIQKNFYKKKRDEYISMLINMFENITEFEAWFTFK